jgi:hypothetical protein
MALKALSPDSASISLGELADFIWGNEIFYGQASKIGNDGELTVVVFDNSVHTPEPVDETARVVVIAGSDDAPADALAFLCQGKAIVGGVEGHVKVFRV